ncbi:MAG TPA: histidine kinase N-terminal 7TM domain-containing protein [Nitrospirales bacterium]|nr:histidine kinase N-terminal 7TM domain-containing protein [Nitrospirales bacterium]
MEFFAISGLLNGLAAIGLASFVYFRAPKDPRHWTFGLFGISTALWSFGYFAWLVSDSQFFALLNLRILMAGAIFIPITFLHHVLYLLKKEHTYSAIIKLNYAVGVIFLLADFTPLFIQGVRQISVFPFWGVPGLAFHFCLIWWVGLVIFAHSLLVQAYAKEKGLRRRQFLYLLVGSGIGYIGGATNYPLWYGIEILPYGTIGFTVYISIVAYTLLRFHWLEFSVYVEKGLSYFAILLFVSQPVYPMLLFAQKSLLGAINVRFSVVQLVLHLLTVVGVYQMKVGTKGAVARTILKGRELRTQALSRFSSKVANIHNIQDLGQAILETVGKSAGASKAAIFVLQVEGNRYRAVSSFGFAHDHPVIQNGWAISDNLPQLLLFTQSRVSIEELKGVDSNEDEKRIAFILGEAGLEVFYPIFGNNQLLGFLALGQISGEAIRMMGGKTFWNTIIQESALALENAILREEIHRSQNLLCQVDRLRSLEAMANGLTQELHSPLVSIKAFVQVAELRRHDGEFMDRLHRIVGEDLAKIEALTKEMREYVKPLSGSLNAKIHVHDIIDSCLLFVASNPSYHKIMIEKMFSYEVPMVSVDRQGLMQVIFNGLLFLFKDPSRLSGTLRIQTQAEREGMGQNWLQVAVWWKAQETSLNSELISIEKWGFDGSFFDEHDTSVAQGLILASQIMQRHSGRFQLLTNGRDILGFQIQLPLSLPYNNEYSLTPIRIPSIPLKQEKVTPEAGHLFS